MVKDTQTGDCFRVDHLIEGKKKKFLIFIELIIYYRKGFLKQLLEARDITDERRAEIEQILPQVNFDYEKI